MNAYIQSLTPRILGKIVDLLKGTVISRERIFLNLGILILVAIFAFITRYIWRYYIMGNARNLETYLRQELFRHFQKLSVEFYNNKKTGDLIAYAINDINAVRMSFGPGIALIVNSLGVSTVAIISMIGIVNGRLTLLTLIPIPIIIILMIKIGKLVQIRFKSVQENFASISDRVQENISGIRIIKSYVQEDKEVDNFDELNNKMKQSSIKMTRVSSLLSPMIEVCFGVSFMISLIYGSNLVRSGVITLGDFVAFNGYLSMIVRPVVSIGRVINISQKGLASFKRLNEIFKVTPNINDDEADKSLKSLEGNIEIKNLFFKYPGCEEYSLENINLKLEKGKVLGIIGKTGSGKTTLLNILLRLYNVEREKVFIDERDINDYPLETIRENIGYVPQDNFLFSATIKSNINFFRDTYCSDEIENATKLSCIFDSIVSFPNGFETKVGERGVNLSGGQKQRLSIARAIIKKPAILILDDSLSAVDNKTEEKIINNFKQIMKDKAGIIIAHRISAVKHADEIVVMDHGKIVERGSHNELLDKEGLYFNIYKEQFKEDKRRKVNKDAS